MTVDEYIKMIEGLHSEWAPHDAQVQIGQALIKDGYKKIFGKCGRNFGKTDLISYLLWRWAKENPGSENYYFAPIQKQAKEIVWATRRLQDFGPRDWLLPGSSGINNTEMRLRFSNGSFIKMDGSDNIDSYRGVKPQGLTVYDEYKDFKPEFHQAMDPNYAAHDSPLIIIGTPPEIEDHHFYHEEEAIKNDPKGICFTFTSYENPHIPHSMFDRKKEELYARGEGDTFEREYMVRKVFGGKSSIFPMLNKDIHIHDHDKLIQELRRDHKKLEWFCVADPGTITCFAVLFGALNPYTRKVYLLDEIYETDQQETSTTKIGPRIIKIQEELNSYGEDHNLSWDNYYDEAEPWFAREMVDQGLAAFSPTAKAKRKKEDGLSLIKDMLLENKVAISDRCTSLFSEMRNYVKDKNGKIPKKNDHLIDCYRYMVDAMGYDMNNVDEPKDIEEQTKETKRFYTIEEDFEDEIDSFDNDYDDDIDLFEEF